MELVAKCKPKSTPEELLGDEGVIDVAIATISVVICLILASAIFTVTAISTRINDAVSQIARNEARAIEASRTYLTSATLDQIASETTGGNGSIYVSAQAIPILGSCPSEYYAVYIHSLQLPFISSNISETVPVGVSVNGC